MNAHALHPRERCFASAEDVPPPPIPAGEPSLSELLREWRAAERDLAGLQPGSAAWRRLQDEIERLRARYQEAFASHNDPDATRSSA